MMAGRLICNMLASLLLVAMVTRGAPAQQTWDYSAYSVQVWVALANDAELTPSLRGQLERTFVQRSEVVLGVVWDLSLEEVPAPLRDETLYAMDLLEHAELRAIAPDALNKDKLFFLAIDVDQEGYHITAREFCCHSRQWGPISAARVLQPELLLHTSFDTLVDAFRPVARIEQAERSDALVRVRAGGLVIDPSNPAAISPRDVLQPVVRRNDRYGQPLEEGIQVVPWTFLQAETAEAALVPCRVFSGLRNPIGGRNSFHVQRYALRVRPRSEHTQLQLLTRGDPPRPLVGYDVYAKDPQLESGTDPNAADVELIGRTDWRGTVTVSQDASTPVRLLYVRNGRQLLARLPVVPGLEPEASAQLASDDLRLEAEAFIAGMQSRILDLVARRQLVAAQIRKHLADKKTAEAERLLEQLRTMETHLDLERVLNQREQQFGSSDPRVQRRIGTLFSDTRKLMAEYLDPGFVNQVSREVAQVQ